MQKLVEKQVTMLNERLKHKKIQVKIQESMEGHLCKVGYDPKFGARPLQSVFNKLVNRPLARGIVKGELVAGSYSIGFEEGNSTINQVIE